MISVNEALDKLFSLVTPLKAETVPLVDGCGRVLARTVTAQRDQPPFTASAMDGYAVIGSEVRPGAQFEVIGESAAGHGYDGRLAPGHAVRIFTGAPLPEGSDHVVIQEDVERDGTRIALGERTDSTPNTRARGADFSKGQEFGAPRLLGPSEIALLASMNIAVLPVTRRPEVALISTGDELVMPGETPARDQIIASNTFGLKALLERAGARARILPIARDNEASLKLAFELAAGADLVVTIGGASVGDHDLVGKVSADLGMERQFYKVAMRPGKPLMAGRMGDQIMIGLPGNPVSAMVCGEVFLLPVVRALLGLGAAPAIRRKARLIAPLSLNGPREHYMRAIVSDEGIRASNRQDSALLGVLAEANALLIRPPNQAPQESGAWVEYLAI